MKSTVFNIEFKMSDVTEFFSLVFPTSVFFGTYGDITLSVSADGWGEYEGIDELNKSLSAYKINVHRFIDNNIVESFVITA